MICNNVRTLYIVESACNPLTVTAEVAGSLVVAAILFNRLGGGISSSVGFVALIASQPPGLDERV